MVETAGGVSFPIVFHDGEQDVPIGSVIVSSSTDFKNFQSDLSKMIGISSHQFTVYLAEYKMSLDFSTKIRRRIPITGKVNFGAISCEKNSFFLVVLKRSRRERRRKVTDNNEDEYYLPSATKTKAKTNQPNKKNPPENVMLLRRNAGIENEMLSGFISPAMDRYDYEERIRKLQLERENYSTRVGLRNLTVGGDGDGGWNGTAKSKTTACRDCLSARETGVAVGFHCCANDAVTAGFRSHAGPIARPIKESEPN